MHGLRFLAGMLFLLALPTSATAAPETMYEGMVGTARVVLSIEQNKGEVSGQYFYRTSRLDIDLSGKMAGTPLRLESRTTGDQLVLNRQEANLTGALTTSKARRLPVSLHPAGVPVGLPDDLPPNLTAYERWHFAGLRFTPAQSETIGGRTIRWYREPLSGIRLFRLERGYAAPAMAAVNHALARSQWQNVAAWFACTDMGGKPGIEVTQAGKPWLGVNHMSYVWTTSWSCAGAAHPDFGTQGYNYDMRTGHALTLDGLLHFGSRPIPHEDSDDWYRYRGKSFAYGVVALLERYHPDEMAPPGTSDDDCNYADPEVWQFPAWALSDKGLWLGAYFARAQRPCDSPDWAIIPWSSLDLPPGKRP
ncbi:hypothetical protein C8J44_3459 [Sphingomonas sp. PP-CE-3A-406]|uniref:hypothetical protein n=1 Tax=Sphingomonas sp. PP-CE-3A-406 TaxID=2135659 RepID=UPI000EF9DE6D|nr:hypothetical protein [Sphingomonas sp. PP-CE-3A-406]RMB52426.1 hypothetical protein C8J44_3459 [Sphingomonas sp. PP-CE-3A-406]